MMENALFLWPFSSSLFVCLPGRLLLLVHLSGRGWTSGFLWLRSWGLLGTTQCRWSWLILYRVVPQFVSEVGAHKSNNYGFCFCWWSIYSSWDYHPFITGGGHHLVWWKKSVASDGCFLTWVFSCFFHVSQCHHPFEIGIFHCKPSSYWAYPDDYGNLQIEPVTRGVVLLSSGTHSMQTKVTIGDNYDLLLKTLLVSLVKSPLPTLGLSENIAKKDAICLFEQNEHELNNNCNLIKYAKCSLIDR